jgi:hypothetical protein
MSTNGKALAICSWPANRGPRKRYLQVTEQRTKADFARFIRDLVDVYYPTAEKLVLVMDNLNTHTLAALYEAFEPAEARRLIEKLELHYTPKHGRGREHGRDRILGAHSAVFGPSHWLACRTGTRGSGLASQTQWASGRHQLALYHD